MRSSGNPRDDFAKSISIPSKIEVWNSIYIVKLQKKSEPTCQNENLGIEKNDIAAIDAPQRDHLEIPGTILIILSRTLSKFGMKIVLLVVHYSC